MNEGVRERRIFTIAAFILMLFFIVACHGGSKSQPDSDSDGIFDTTDNCPQTFNPNQEDSDGDGIGDACELALDTDGDGIADPDDNCPAVSNQDQADGDGDDVGDLCDNCPADQTKTEPGICGCGLPDTDSDNDGTLNCNDDCPDDPGKTAPGVCGCGTADMDTDNDGALDCNDNCPNDPNKTAPGICGCSILDVDSDNDGTADCNDGCPTDPNKIEPGACGCGVADTDSDGDGFADCIDICPGFDDNIDSDGDGIPDGCDSGGELPPDPADVAPEVDSTVATSLFTSTEFLYTGSNPLQTGMEPLIIEENRVSVLRGQVMTQEGAPLPGVTITILNHSEYGQTLSRDDGMFDLAVNGGEFLTVNYGKAGYLPVQRRVNVPWRNWVRVPDVVLIELETTVTEVDLTQAAKDFVVAQGAVISDARGSRQATLLFPQGTQAELVMPDGSTQAISTLNFRATEYSVGPNGPEAMPGILPPGVGYTYCVEFSVDEALSAGAKTVNFNIPLINYVENFLDFPTGVEVPAYYYDKERGVWMTSQNGLVIKIVTITGGVADLDTNGDDAADDPTVLATLGITDEERLQLGSLYSADQSLWRVPINHFSPVDYNWTYVYPTNQYPPPYVSVSSNNANVQDCTSNGSIIECQSQTLGESIGITGTPFTLDYRSNRTPGRRDNHTLNIMLFDYCKSAECPQSIELEVDIAGQHFTQSFPPDPDQHYIFTWDGNDAYGRRVYGGQSITVKVGYKYTARRCDGLGDCMIVPNSYDTLWSGWQGIIGTIDTQMNGLGGWTLNVNHVYDLSNRILLLGNGDRLSAQYFQNGALTTVAGNGTRGYSGDGGPATQAQLNSPEGISFGPDGSLFIADTVNQRIRKVDTNGIITTVAGTGVVGFSGDGGPALNANLYAPSDVAVGSDGSLYIADHSNVRIRKVDPSGIITTIAGNGEYCGGSDPQCGYDGPATEIAIGDFSNISLGIDDSIYIGAQSQDQILRLGQDGILSIVAGTFNNYAGIFAGDGGPAEDAMLYLPTDAVQAPDGSLYINDINNKRVRKVSPDGIINTVAGNGIYTPPSGDGGPATLAQFYSSSVQADLALGQDGSLYIPDYYHGRIRRVSPDGIITTVAGNISTTKSSPDGTPAINANLGNYMGNIAIGPNGNLYIANTWNPSYPNNHNVIRKIEQGFPNFSFTEILIASLDGTELYVFNSSGKHLRTINTLTGSLVYEFSYDDKGLLIEIEDAFGRVTTVERDFEGNPTAIVSPYGQTTTLSLDSNGFIKSIANPASETWQFIYTDDGLLTSSIDPNSNASAYTYDDLGLLILAEDAGGGSQTLDRTKLEMGYEVTRTTEMGRTSTYHLEVYPTGAKYLVNTLPCGCLSETFVGIDGTQTSTAPDTTVTTFQHGPDPRFGIQSPIIESMNVSTPGGLNLSMNFERSVTLADASDLLSLQTMTDTTSINGRILTSEYDAITNTRTKTTPAGRTRNDTFNEQQQLIESIVPGLEPMGVYYDVDGRMTNIVHGTGTAAREVSISYNSGGFISGITDPVLRSANFAYDAAGKITSQTLPGGREVLFNYDAKGNIMSITPPNQPPHNFFYTSVDNLEEYVPPALGATPVATTYIYNPDRQLTQIQRPDGATLDIGYDTAGRVSTRTLPRGTVSYTYDGISGLLNSVSAPGSETLSFAYDGSFITDRNWSGTITGSIEQAYDNNFHIISRSVNGASTIAFTYDQDGLLTQAGSLSITRDPGNGYITGTTLGSAADSLTYNGFGESLNYTASYGGNPRFTTQYTRDKLGRITEKIETVEGTTNTYTYMYDTAGRLTQVAENGSTIESYAFDDNGNRLSANGVSATHDDQDRLIQSGTTTYAYTANGDLYTKTVGTEITTYTYDVLGNLIRVILPDTTQIDYIIDGVNHRIGKKVNGSLIQGFLYKDQLNPIVELDGSGTIVSRFVYGSKSNVPDFMIKGGNTYRIVSDHLGSPRLVIDIATGTTAQRLDYDSFGKVMTDTNPGFQPFGFAGGLYDPLTGLTRFGARDYDAEVGRWTTKDPILFAGGTSNLFGYVLNDPVNLTDLNGLAMSAANADTMRSAALGPTTSLADLIAGEIAGVVVGIANAVGDLDAPAPGLGPGYILGESIGNTMGYLNREYSAYIELQSADQLSNLYDRLIREHQEREIQQLMDEIRELLYGCN